MRNYEDVKRWSDLLPEERELYNIKVAILGHYLEENIGVLVTWNQVNNILGLTHLYRWTFDRMEEDFASAGLNLAFNDDGIYVD